jgi:ribosomal protein S18 acetylase RimI-like enzyme
MALTLRLRPVSPSDLPFLAAIEVEAFPDPSWTAPDFLRYDCMVAEVQSGPDEFAVAGFLVSRENYKGTEDAPPEREILNLAVDKRFRRAGVASSLLRHEVERRTDIYLEVRQSNIPAIQLYTNVGFTEIARRSNYYDNPLESAIVMRMKW